MEQARDVPLQGDAGLRHEDPLHRHGLWVRPRAISALLQWFDGNQRRKVCALFFFYCAVEIPQGEEHPGVQRDVQGVLLVRGDVTAERSRAHRQVGGGGGRQVWTNTEAYLALSSPVNHDWHWFLSVFFIYLFLSGWRILLLKLHLQISKISKTKPPQMAAIRIVRLINFKLKLNLSSTPNSCVWSDDDIGIQLREKFCLTQEQLILA